MLIFISIISATGLSTNVCQSTPFYIPNKISEIQKPIENVPVYDASKFMRPFYENEKIEYEKSQEENPSDQSFRSNSNEKVGSSKEKLNEKVHDSVDKSQKEDAENRLEIPNDKKKEKYTSCIPYDKSNPLSSLNKEMETDNFENILENSSYDQDIISEDTQKFECLRLTPKPGDGRYNFGVYYYQEINDFLSRINADEPFENFFEFLVLFFPEYEKMEFFEFLNNFKNINIIDAKKKLINMLEIFKKILCVELKGKNICAKFDALLKRYSNYEISQDSVLCFKLKKYQNDIDLYNNEIKLLENEFKVAKISYDKMLKNARPRVLKKVKI
ncbi:hypothetical protein GVAV_002692 [Gurleya vavrai]